MKIPVSLSEQDFDALKVLAKNEYRDVRGQAAAIIREELRKRGLINVNQENPSSQIDLNKMKMMT